MGEEFLVSFDGENEVGSLLVAFDSGFDFFHGKEDTTGGSDKKKHGGPQPALSPSIFIFVRAPCGILSRMNIFTKLAAFVRRCHNSGLSLKRGVR
ncbi:MAG: hypothetical protein OK454_09100, partial [Thaumarchaeota archaeon]|nr:hypothetical protein [Nitrososphaerota archaeon]